MRVNISFTIQKNKIIALALLYDCNIDKLYDCNILFLVKAEKLTLHPIHEWVRADTWLQKF